MKQAYCRILAWEVLKEKKEYVCKSMTMSKSVQLQVVTLQQTQFASKCLIAFLEQFLNLSKSTSNSLLCPSSKVFALENRKPITFLPPQIHRFPCLRFHFRLVMESWFIPNIKNVTFTIGVDIIYSNVFSSTCSSRLL